MNTNQQRTLYGGLALIGLGIFAAFGLWWLLPIALLAAVGATVYTQQRRAGRLAEAVQGGLWGVGLAIMLLFGFWWSGLVILAGISLLARGREQQFDAVAQRLIGRAQGYVQTRRNSSISVPAVTRPSTTSINSSTPTNTITIVNDEAPEMGDTTRLHK